MFYHKAVIEFPLSFCELTEMSPSLHTGMNRGSVVKHPHCCSTYCTLLLFTVGGGKGLTLIGDFSSDFTFERESGMEIPPFYK